MLEQYRQWGQKVRGVPRNRRERKQLERPVLWRDAYADRPFTNQQRLRSGALPVVERNPALTIDDTGQSVIPHHHILGPQEGEVSPMARSSPQTHVKTTTGLLHILLWLCKLYGIG